MSAAGGAGPAWSFAGARSDDRDRQAVGSGSQGPRQRAPLEGDRIKFISRIIPPYLRKAQSVADLIPWLYLKGVSTGDFGDALTALFGADAPGVSVPTIARMKQGWKKDHDGWRKRDLSGRRFTYVWADGVYFKPRLDSDRQCMLVMIGADEDGHKDIHAAQDGFRENTNSWRGLLLDLKSRGLSAPCLAIGDGSLGYWLALRDIYPESREQRCWVQ